MKSIQEQSLRYEAFLIVEIKKGIKKLAKSEILEYRKTWALSIISASTVPIFYLENGLMNVQMWKKVNVALGAYIMSCDADFR